MCCMFMSSDAVSRICCEDSGGAVFMDMRYSVIMFRMIQSSI
jgi:hypothetical protein